LRHEFPRSVKDAARARSGGRCEAIGPRYGHLAGERCTAVLGQTGIQYDHWPRGAHDPHPDTRTLGNCTACCPACNQYAANHTDKAVEAKIKRVQILHGLREPKRKPPKPIPSRGFRKSEPQHKATSPIKWGRKHQEQPHE
jgi:hypothetical protein